MLDELVTAYGNRFLVAALGVSLALLGLFVVLWLLRHRAPSPFVRGGRNRQPRLQVLDAAAIDARRRLVLVRRDNIEHLVMIGGPTDIVIESGIGEDRPYISVQQPAKSLAAAPVAPAEPVAVATAPETRRVAAPAASLQQSMTPASPDDHPLAAPPRLEPQAERPMPMPQPVRAVAPASAPATAMSPAPREQPASARAAAPVVHAEPPPTAVQRPLTAEPPLTAPKVEDLLETARQRVLPPDAPAPVVAPSPMTSPAPKPSPAATATVGMTPARPQDAPDARPTSPAGEPDFEKFLEDEMTSHLEAVKAARSEQLVTRPAPTVLPPTPPVSAALSGLSAPRPAPHPAPNPASPTAMPSAPAPGPSAPQAQRPAQPPKEEPNLQQEIARIFGEMTAGRND